MTAKKPTTTKAPAKCNAPKKPKTLTVRFSIATNDQDEWAVSGFHQNCREANCQDASGALCGVVITQDFEIEIPYPEPSIVRLVHPGIKTNG